MGLALLKSGVTQTDVEVAWATYRALVLAEAEGNVPSNDGAHQLAIATAKQRFERLYADWTQQ